MAQIWLKMIPKNYSCRSMMSSDPIIRKLWNRGSKIFDISQKWCSEKWRTGILKVLKSKLLVQKSFKYGLKWAKEMLELIHDFLRPIFFSKFCNMGLLILVIRQKRFSEKWQTGILKLPKSKLLVQKENFEKNWSEEFLDQLEYLFGIILSHIWGFLHQWFGFRKKQYTRPSLFSQDTIFGRY